MKTILEVFPSYFDAYMAYKNNICPPDNFMRRYDLDFADTIRMFKAVASVRDVGYPLEMLDFYVNRLKWEERNVQEATN